MIGRTFFLFVFLVALPGTSALSANQNLSVGISVQEGDEGSGVVTFSLTNQSRYPVQVLRWNTPLEGGFRSDNFRVTLNGEKIRYIGKLVKRAPAEPGDYLLLGPGESTSARAALLAEYDIREAGRYEVTYAAVIEYAVQDPAAKSKSLQEKLHSNTLLLYIAFIPKPLAAAKEAATFFSCSAERMVILDNALGEAEKYALESRGALQNVATIERPVAKRYTAWFGAYTAEYFSTALDHFTRLAAALSNETIEFRCDCTEYYFAYVYVDEPYIIHICNEYWNAPLAGTDSQAGTIIHEMSHFAVVAGTDDHTYGQKNSLALAISNPVDALDNADSHEYFAENHPFMPMAAVYVPTNTFGDAPFVTSVPAYAMGSSTGANKEPGEPEHAGSAGGSSVWLGWTAPVSGTVQMSTLGSTFDTLLAVYTGSEVGSLSQVAANDDADSEANIYQSLVTFAVQAGQTYRIAVDGFGGATGNVSLAVTAHFGDIDHSGAVELVDLLLAMKVLAGMPVDEPVYADADVNGDGLIGLAEVLYIFREVAGDVQ